MYWQPINNNKESKITQAKRESSIFPEFPIVVCWSSDTKHSVDLSPPKKSLFTLN